LDLFCGEPQCRLNAIHALFRTPQNNLRVFVDGQLVFPLRRDAAELEADAGAAQPDHGSEDRARLRSQLRRAYLHEHCASALGVAPAEWCVATAL
jgi:hypothetical protein